MNSSSSQSKLSLAVDTSSRALCLAISRGAEIIFSHQDASGLQQSERLFPLIEEGLRAAEITIEDIENFIVVTGPGSFTGLRAGIASVQGLASSAGKKQFGVSTFDTLALAANIIDDPLAVIVNASRGDVYFGVRTVSENLEVRVEVPDTIIAMSDVASKIQALNLQHCISTMPEFAEIILPEVNFINATEMNLAQELVAKSAEIISQPKYENATPYYLRLSDAEVNLKAT
jgi:tRNA threonylcarbamoyladenosine biosynthesis protein TsaB